MGKTEKPKYARNDSVKFRLAMRGSPEYFGEVDAVYADATDKYKFSYEIIAEGEPVSFFIPERNLRRA